MCMHLHALQLQSLTRNLFSVPSFLSPSYYHVYSMQSLCFWAEIMWMNDFDVSEKFISFSKKQISSQFNVHWVHSPCIFLYLCMSVVSVYLVYVYFMYVCMCSCVYVCVMLYVCYVCVYVSCVYMFVCVLYVYVCVCICVCMYVCVCVCIH